MVRDGNGSYSENGTVILEGFTIHAKKETTTDAFMKIYENIDKHFNGGLGYTEVAIKGYNKIPNHIKRHYSYKLSKFIDVKPGKIFQNSKAFVNKAGKVAGKLGKVSTALSVASGAVDVFDDGQVKTSTAVNMTLLAVGLAFPGTAPFILAYGVLDYTFDISGKLDEKFGSFNTHIYD
ncbi:hypothetical protein ACNFNZ_17050 [Empedobacter brevis]